MPRYFFRATNGGVRVGDDIGLEFGSDQQAEAAASRVLRQIQATECESNGEGWVVDVLDASNRVVGHFVLGDSLMTRLSMGPSPPSRRKRGHRTARRSSGAPQVPTRHSPLPRTTTSAPMLLPWRRAAISVVFLLVVLAPTVTQNSELPLGGAPTVALPPSHLAGSFEPLVPIIAVPHKPTNAATAITETPQVARSDRNAPLVAPALFKSTRVVQGRKHSVRAQRVRHRPDPIQFRLAARASL